MHLECVAHVNLACSLTGEAETQKSHLREALGLNPKCVQARFQMACLLDDEKAPAKALEQLERGLAEDPQNLNCLSLRCRCLEDLGQHKEALAACEQLCQTDIASTYIALKEVFRCQSDDVFVVTFPRCGTTWMVQIVTCILFGPAADYDLHAVFVEGSLAQDSSSIWTLERMARPRIMKMHVPADVHPGLVRKSETELQEHGKVVYVVRAPKDALVSLRHHHTNNAAIAFAGDWEEWVTQWLAGDRSREYGGTYFEHVKRWWKLSRLHPERIKIVYFEDMKADLVGVITDVAAFLGRHPSANEVAQMAERCAFDTMKTKHRVEDSIRERVNPVHFRKGEVDAWREVLTEEQASRVDIATREQLRDELAQGLRLHGV